MKTCSINLVSSEMIKFRNFASDKPESVEPKTHGLFYVSPLNPQIAYG